MPAIPLPLADAGDIIRLVGPISFQRGRDYAAHGAVIEISWDAEALVLRGIVRGSTPQPYHCSIVLAPSRGKFSTPASSICSCPMAFDCKHVAATLLASNAHSVRSDFAPPTPPAPAQPHWKSAVGALAGINPRDDLTSTALALQFELRELIPRTRSRWNGPSAKTATAPADIFADHRLAVRPVIRSKTGNWVRAGVTWTSLGYQSNRLDVAPGPARWFAQFAALQRASREMYSGQEPDWIYLDDFHSPLLWRLFAEAGGVGVSLVGTKKDSRVVIGHEAQLSLDAHNAGAEGGSLTLSPVLVIDEQQLPIAQSAAIGDHGVYSWQLEPHFHYTLAPTAHALSEEQIALFSPSSTVTVPAADVDEFLADYYPRLARAITVTSSDDTVELPEISPPVLVLTVTFAPEQTIKLGWHWAYGAERRPLREPKMRDSGMGDKGRDDDRDELVEAATLGRVRGVLELETSTRVDTVNTFQGLDAAEFAHHILPTLERLDGVRVDFVGKRPDYRELTETPKLKIKTVETDKRDWFDLGVYVTVEGRDVPFTKLFTALSKGQTKLLLVDNSYLSLTQPIFDELRRLIDEAATLDEWQTGVRISRYQSALWSDFEDLADETEQATAWRDAAAGLRNVETLEAAPLPVGLDATLRPYQHDGYSWLTFLWKHQLGGVLADDMGLGKTLQALALVAHAEAKTPFLVVAPTSVVSNWLAEAARFVPGLVVAGVTSTKQDLAALANGANIVVTSYALFRLGFANYQQLPWAGLILDEAQFVKNAASKAHECAVDLNTPFKLAITGTPLENSLTDLWSLFHIVAPGLFASGRRFGEEYVRPIAAGAGPELMAKLRRRIRPLMMRRTKELVATELPAKQEQVLSVDLVPRHRALYDTFLQKERQKLLGLIDDLDKNRFIVFRSITLLRMLSLDASLVDEQYSDIPSAKLQTLFEQLDDVVAEGHRALVFSQFTSFLKKAADRMDAAGIPYEYLDGSTLKRADVIARYKTGDAPVFLISLKAGGFGLNLTEADYVFLLDPWWNPASENQAIDRTHRIGQTRPVNVYRLVSAGTIEEKVMALKDKKAQLFDAVMDDDAVFSTALTADDIRGLLD